ncbi:hypothetical protein BH11ACT7_BH11ACT7_33420 [soil metagenome]
MAAGRLHSLVIAGSTLLGVLTLTPSAVASAEPADDTQSGPGIPMVTVETVQTVDSSSPAALACAQFATALDGSAAYYGYFAETIDGTQRPDYSDPAVSSTNTLGRTALRQAAALAMSAAGTPGLQPEIAAAMRVWSVDATKLLLKMGLRGGGDTLNATATELNTDATSVQTACAAAGTHA